MPIINKKLVMQSEHLLYAVKVTNAYETHWEL